MKELMVVVVTGSVLTACQDTLSMPETDRGLPPRVHLTTTFDDSPVEGELVITPVGESAWVYGVDLNDDGSPDASGTANSVIRIPYRFETVGPHEIAASFQLEDRVVTEQLFAVVNDVDAIRVVQTTDLIDPLDGFLEGITSDGERVFVARSTMSGLTILDTSDLSVVGRVEFASLSIIQGLSLAPDDELLYVITKDADLRVLQTPMGELAHEFPVNGRFFVQGLRANRALAAGETSELVLIDTENGDVLQSFDTTSSGHFHHSEPTMEIALIDQTITPESESGEVILLDSVTLTPQWRVDIEQGLPRAVAIPPMNTRVYVYYVNEDRCGALILSRASGTVLRDFPLGSDCRPRVGLGVSNPAAVTADGRFVVFPTLRGAFFIDTTLDLPIFRTPQPASDFCCDVAADPLSTSVYFSGGRSGRVSKVDVIR